MTGGCAHIGLTHGQAVDQMTADEACASQDQGRGHTVHGLPAVPAVEGATGGTVSRWKIQTLPPRGSGVLQARR